jgi:hypothetical protein
MMGGSWLADGSYPRTEKGGKLVIISLSETLLDASADLKIRAKCDDVMKALMVKLGYKVPVYGVSSGRKGVAAVRQPVIIISHCNHGIFDGCFLCCLGVSGGYWSYW